jgi:hypothetical protein
VPGGLISLATLPLRVALRAADLALEASWSVASRLLRAGGADADVPLADEPPPRATEQPTTRRPVTNVRPDAAGRRRGTGSRDAGRGARGTATRPVPGPPPRPAPKRRRPPAHVSEEPVVVAQTADLGAQDGAGAEVSVAEPWSGYRRMNAGEVVARLSSAPAPEVAVVQLYEQAHRRRTSVLEAAERRLRLLSGPASR